MTTSMHVRTKKALRSLGLVLASMLLALSPIATRTALAKDAAGRPVVVSLGDSYSSGEGTEPFYGQSSSNKYSNEDWLAHRSEQAWPGKLQLGSATLASGKGDWWHFVAASGALIKNVTTEAQDRPWSQGSSSGTYQLPVQISVFPTKGIEGSVDYVTITLGGNDYGFRDIMTTAATELSLISSGTLQSKINQAQASLDSTILPALKECYQDVLAAAGDQATLIVVGYPHLLADNMSSNLLFNKTEASLINAAIDTFDTKLASSIADMNNPRIVYVDPRAAFSGHEAYSQDSYINSVTLGAEAQDLDQSVTVSSYSLHPNAKGQTAYASCVQPVIDELERAAAPVAVEGISVAPTTATLGSVGATVQMSATVAPTNASNKSYAWSSSDEKVATVSATGLVSAVGEGTATITATTEDGGKTASCTVTVQLPAKTYTVTFANWDGTTLLSREYAEGDMPSYSGATPTREATAEYSYSFRGWDPAIEPVTAEATYTAQFDAQRRSYTITWKDGDGHVLANNTVAYGATPSYAGAAPTKEATAEYNYVFNGSWQPAVAPVTGNATYTAQFDATPIETTVYVPVYRMYNTLSSEHLFTTDFSEYDACGKGAYAHWNAEGVAWMSPAEDDEDAVAVYRLYNAGLGDHHYTMSTDERDRLIAKYGWVSEGVAFYSGGDIPIYRLYNGGLKCGQHHYTMSLDERDRLVAKHGWTSEDVGFYALASGE